MAAILRPMTRLGEFVDVHITRAQKIVALIVGIIALAAALGGGIVWLSHLWRDASHASREQALVTEAASPTGYSATRCQGRSGSGTDRVAEAEVVVYQHLL